MPVRELFHMMHIVGDFDEADARSKALLAPEVFMAKSWSDFDKRWASLGVVSTDFVLEIMEPSKLQADLGHPLPKFFARHGPHWHSLSWYVDAESMEPLMDRMRDHGVRVLTPYPGSVGTFFTHPKDTFGQLEFQARPAAGDRDPHLRDGWSGAFWADEQPLGILRTSHITTVVADVDRARSFYCDVLDATVFHEEKLADRHSAFALVGTDTVLEMAEPSSADSRLARDLAVHGEIPHAVTFSVRSLDAVEAHLGAIGVGIAERSSDTLVADPADLSNAVVGFTTRQLPGDPRP